MLGTLAGALAILLGGVLLLALVMVIKYTPWRK